MSIVQETQMPSALHSASPPPSPPPLPPPPFKDPTSEYSGESSSSNSYNLSLLIIAAILAFVFVISASIHHLLRLLSRSSSSHPLIRRNNSSASTTTTTSSSPSDQDPKVVIDSLPIVTLSSLAPPRPSLDCAVCLTRFGPHDELRLLPACRHAFHPPCIDKWLRSTLSCPLCRSSITRPPPPPAAAPPARSDSIRLSIEHMEEEAVVEQVWRRAESGKIAGAPPAEEAAEVAEMAGGGGKGWLKEYVDRMASSASSSFSSLRISPWGSRRFDGGEIGGGGSCNLESDAGGEESGYFASSYRWLTGASS